MRVLLALVLFGLLLNVPIEDFAYTERGKKRRRVDRTTEDHIHIGMSKAGAQARTSFWAGR